MYLNVWLSQYVYLTAQINGEDMATVAAKQEVVFSLWSINKHTTKPCREEPYLFFVFARTIIDGNCDIYKTKLEYYYIYDKDLTMLAYNTQTQVVLPR